MDETQSSPGRPPIVLLTITITALLVWAGIFISSHPFLEDLCGNKVMGESNSPDGVLKAVVFERDCGATTGFSTQLSILKVSERLPNEGGNTFIEDAGHDPALSLEVKTAWISNDELVVYRDPKARVFHAVENYHLPMAGKTVKIQYRDPATTEAKGVPIQIR